MSAGPQEAEDTWYELDPTDPTGQYCDSDSVKGKRKRKRKRVSFTTRRDFNVLPLGGSIGTASESCIDYPVDLTGKEISDSKKDAGQSLAAMSSINKKEAGTKTPAPIRPRTKTDGKARVRSVPLDPEEGVDNVLSEAIPRSIRKSQTSAKKDPYSSAEAISGYMCSVCKKEFGTRIMLEIHARRCWAQGSGTSPTKTLLLSKSATNKKTYNPKHDPYYPTYKCNLCNKEFASKQWLVIHQKRMHDILATFRCKICGVVFNENHKLLSHVEQKHQAESRILFTNIQ